MDVLARREVVFFIIFFMAHLRNETLNEIPNLVSQPDCKWAMGDGSQADLRNFVVHLGFFIS